MHHSTRLRELIDRDGALVCPGVHDPLTARVADQCGFDAIYASGYGTSLSVTGYPDAGLITMPEMVSNANNIQETVDVPVIADADNGYGNAVNTVRTIREYIKSGVSGVHIEDQAFPKRCGALDDKQYVSREEAVGKIAAAADVRDERDEAFVVIARTDVPGLEEKIERGNAYADAGADVVFPTGATSSADVEQLGREIDAPLLYTNSAVSDSPVVSADRLSEFGYDIVVYWDLSTLATIANVHSYFRGLQEDGAAVLSDLEAEFDAASVGDLHEFAGIPDILSIEEAYVPADTE